MADSQLAQHFKALYGREPRVYCAPGRVNLIGEHTDYNDGFVLPCAIGFFTRVAIAARDDRQLVVRSEEFSEPSTCEVDSLPARGTGAWSDYILGVALMLRQGGCRFGGADLLVHGEVPIGSGLSSSAALEVASALALISLNGASFTPPEIAKLCQRAENEFIGAKVGIMDQFVSCLGRAGHALLLDCRSLEFKLVPISPDVRLVICNTMVKHAHSSGEYNRRREECEAGVAVLAARYPGIRALRDVSLAQLEANRSRLAETVYKRCLHIVQENQRVLDTVECLDRADMTGVGELMGDSHRSLRDLFEVSCRELDIMVDAAQGLPGFIGGRMTGGGFGGCTVNLVRAEEAAEFARQIAEAYRGSVGIRPEVYVCSAADGAAAELEKSRRTSALQ